MTGRPFGDAREVSLNRFGTVLVMARFWRFAHRKTSILGRDMDDKMVWLLGVLVVMAAIGLLMLYGELQNASKKEAIWLGSVHQRKPHRSIPSDYRSRSRR